MYIYIYIYIYISIYIYIYTYIIYIYIYIYISSLFHQASLIALKEALENRSVKKILTENLIKMAEFVLKSNSFEFNNKVFQQ